MSRVWMKIEDRQGNVVEFELHPSLGSHAAAEISPKVEMGLSHLFMWKEWLKTFLEQCIQRDALAASVKRNQEKHAQEEAQVQKEIRSK